ncbi:MAG: phosphatidylglycerophosphatase A [Planctomycetes bacterium]|jgi:phosphatidylglycerophosphatase A|nr:phosphatidylglycerophosphatase A [Planctomycetota bacterium]
MSMQEKQNVPAEATAAHNAMSSGPKRSSWRKWVITGGGLGLLKPAPGSWGTLGPAIVFWILLWARVADPWRSMVCLFGAMIAGILTVQLSPWAIRYFGREDPGPVVLDEYCGYWIACLFLPLPRIALSNLWHAWLASAAVYILFRLFDTLKVPPCRQLEHLPAGWGILLDDIAAGIQVNVLLQVALRIPHY